MEHVATTNSATSRSQLTSPDPGVAPHNRSSSSASVNMSHNEPSKMQSSQSYPSPNAMAVGGGTGPFYSQPQRISPIESLQLNAPPAHNTLPPLSAVSTEGDDRSSAFPPINRNLGESPSDQGALMEGDPNDDSIQTDSTTPRKRSKVSRACDECRRKKVTTALR